MSEPIRWQEDECLHGGGLTLYAEHGDRAVSIRPNFWDDEGGYNVGYVAPGILADGHAPTLVEAKRLGEQFLLKMREEDA